MSEPTAREMLARLLRQREEMGAPPIILEGLKKGEALELAGTRTRGAIPTPGQAGATTTGRPPRPSGAPRSPFASPDRPAAASSAPRPAPPVRPAAQPAAAAAAVPSGALAPGAPLPVLPSSHAELAALVSGCMRCGLAEGRTQVVFNDGVLGSRVMVVGEAPGKNEDETGLPFVGAAGKLLDLLLLTIDLSRKESVYICNVLKCRPPGNRNPMPDEIEACRGFLEKQIEIVQPEVILGVGTFAAQWLTRSQAPLGKLRGGVYSYQGVPLVVTYHPAALLRNPGWTPATWDDFQLVRQLLDRRA